MFLLLLLVLPLLTPFALPGCSSENPREDTSTHTSLMHAFMNTAVLWQFSGFRGNRALSYYLLTWWARTNRVSVKFSPILSIAAILKWELVGLFCPCLQTCSLLLLTLCGEHTEGALGVETKGNQGGMKRVKNEMGKKNPTTNTVFSFVPVRCLPGRIYWSL